MSLGKSKKPPTASQSLLAADAQAAYKPTPLPDAENPLDARKRAREAAKKRRGRSGTLLSGQITDEPVLSTAIVTGKA